jgi:hypothetical protein
MLLRSSFFVAALLAAAPLWAVLAGSGVDEAFGQTRTTGVTATATGTGTTGTTFPTTPSATTAPYQAGGAPSYSSWPPSTPTTSGYRSTQPTYQTTPGIAGPASGVSPNTTAACSPATPVGAAPTTAGTATSATGVGCP